MTKLAWQVTENNGGGITLYVWAGDRLIYAHAGYEYTEPQQLRDNLEELVSGAHPINDGWEGNDLVNEDIVRGVRGVDTDTGYKVDDEAVVDASGNIIPLTQDEYYDNHQSTKVICDEEGPIDVDDMGAAGRKIFLGAK